MGNFKTLSEAYEDQRKREYNEYLLSTLKPEEQERYTIIDGLEGPIKLRSGKIVYYDPAEGQYYDRDTDMYIPADEIQMHSENFILMEREDEKYFGYGTPFWGQGHENISKLSPLGHSLYSELRRAGDGPPFHLTRDEYAKYSNIDANDLYNVIDIALDYDFQITDEIWDLMKRKDPKLYRQLRLSIGKDQPASKLPNDFELYHILRSNPNFKFHKNAQYKPNAGRFMYGDLKKRIKASSTTPEEADTKIKELDDFITSKRRFTNI